MNLDSRKYRRDQYKELSKSTVFKCVVLPISHTKQRLRYDYIKKNHKIILLSYSPHPLCVFSYFSMFVKFRPFKVPLSIWLG